MDTSKIIKGVVGGGRYTVTAPITQWDYGYIFQPIIENLPTTYRLDFSNDEHQGTAYPVYCGADGGEVPKSLIDTGKDIFVWLFYIGEDYGKSTYKWRIPNHLKPKNEEEEPTPSQQSSIDQLIVRSNEAVETAEQSTEEAGRSAQSAAESAESASASAAASANSASASAQSATDAQTYATQASQSAQRASASANMASAAATSASASASSTATNADRAEQAAAQSGYMFFYIDENGDLHYQRTDNVDVDFYLNDGDLYVRAGS